jgi:hypothetical protein
MLPVSANAGEKFQLNGGGQRKGVSDGYSYELWIDNTGGNGSMTLGNGGTFEAVWNCSVPQGNYLARRGMDFAKDNKNALSYGNIQMDYDATYTASSAGNSRLCVYGWFAENTAPQVSGTVVEYYIIEDWVNWCPKPDGQSKTVKIDGADYEIFRIKHTGPTIRNGGGSETFWQYFSIRKSKRTSGTISVSEHFQAWKDAGFEIYNLYEVALNAEGWESSGSANVTKLEMTVGKDPTCTEEGYYQGNCPDCGRRNVRQPIPALGHDWDQGSIIRPATQTTDGIMRYTCARCGEINDEIIPKTMHVHDYNVTVVPPTCTTEGYTNHKCACGDEYNDNFVRPAHKWDKGTVSKAPTATTEGSMKYTCTVCGTYRYETIPATGEQPTGVVDVECSRDVQEVVFKSNTPWPDKGYQRISGSGRASYRIMYEDRYVRIELIDDRGRKAWCSPFAVK